MEKSTFFKFLDKYMIRSYVVPVFYVITVHIWAGMQKHVFGHKRTAKTDQDRPCPLTDSLCTVEYNNISRVTQSSNIW